MLLTAAVRYVLVMGFVYIETTEDKTRKLSSDDRYVVDRMSTVGGCIHISKNT